MIVRINDMNTVSIPLTGCSDVALVDAEHAHLVQGLSWGKSNDYAVHGTYYNKIRSLLYMHRVIWEAINGPIPEGLEIDHRNGNRVDNRLNNLKVVTRRINAHNRKERREGITTSSFVGVTWHKSTSKWYSQIQVNGNRVSLGLFEKEEDAARAYQNALAKIEEEQ
jgi:hypothetical protein